MLQDLETKDNSNESEILTCRIIHLQLIEKQTRFCHSNVIRD